MTGYIEVNGIKMYYERYGKGDPLILISGLGGDSAYWHVNIRDLEQNYEVILFDNRGVGKTDISDSAYSISLLADDTAALIKALALPPVHVLGISMGGVIARSLVTRYPALVKKLILVATFPVINQRARLFFDAVLSVGESGATDTQRIDLMVPLFFSETFLANPANAGHLGKDKNIPSKQSFYGWKKQYSALRGFDDREEIKNIKAPTLIMAGDEDYIAPVEDARLLNKLIPGSCAITVYGSGHLVNLEYPGDFSKAVKEFLN